MKTVNFLIVCLVIAAITAISSCKEDPPYAKISVIDEAKKPVSGVRLAIFAPEGQLDTIYLYTNSAGVAEMEFENENLFQVIAILFDEGIPIKTGTGVLRLQKDVVCEETITIRP
ncbi:MAG: hypothetical protein A2W91_03110 [Bacteroidetes bacterium GWF2_38_335]|nr:MAG: hypothetical protein A2W91_03110 [Bacteroidetes bacterium GWF2_38_335]OFY77521.1 MAG: hypothetical protein A2281_01650 [Bacteroidetes bacterium RIFOXYA12_FULL_38_20]HBS87183.1 hypothetical protein [Bacteroidales bacterium]